MMIKMWIDIVVVILLALGIYGFVSLARMQTHRLSDHTTRTVDSMYEQYGDSPKKQRRFAQAHGGTWRDDGTAVSDREPETRPR
jgi:hypothetical protein